MIKRSFVGLGSVCADLLGFYHYFRLSYLKKSILSIPACLRTEDNVPGFMSLLCIGSVTLLATSVEDFKTIWLPTW